MPRGGKSCGSWRHWQPVLKTKKIALSTRHRLACKPTNDSANKARIASQTPTLRALEYAVALWSTGRFLGCNTLFTRHWKKRPLTVRPGLIT